VRLSFGECPFRELSGNYEWTRFPSDYQPRRRVKGLLRLEGSCVITDAGGITGALRVGVTPQTLQWIPGSRERVFTVAQNGYVWTDVKISGSLKDLREDLTPRLVAAMQDETIHQGTKIIRELPNAAREGAQGALDAWFGKLSLGPSKNIVQVFVRILKGLRNVSNESLRTFSISYNRGTCQTPKMLARVMPT
jgi:hypothetical protein